MASSFVGGSHSAELLVHRLSQFVTLSLAELNLVRSSRQRAIFHPADSEINAAGKPLAQAQIVISGWIARECVSANGRRFILSVSLPGDLLGGTAPDRAVDRESAVALTDVKVISAAAILDAIRDEPGAFASLSRALGELRRAEEGRLLDSLVRVGCQTALERTAALFLELYGRCASIGFVQDGSFLMPLTQEVLGRMLGISVVHVNRVIAELKSCGLVEVRKGSATILDFPKLRQLAGEVADRCQANHVEYGTSYRAA